MKDYGDLQLTWNPVTRDSDNYGLVQKLYETAFPADERAPLDMLIDGHEWKGDNRAYYVDCEFAGLAFVYVDDRFCYLFYLAVDPAHRKRGVGSAIIRDLIKCYPDRRLILEMEELDPAADNYIERINRARFYQSNGLHLTDVHNTQFGVDYHVMCTDPAITLGDYSRMWHNIVAQQGYTPESGRQWLRKIFGNSIEYM